VRLEEPLEHEHTVTIPGQQPFAAEPPVIEEPVVEPAEVVETVVIEDAVSVAAAVKPPGPEENIQLPEPEVPAVPPPPPPHPDLSKLFAPEDATPRVFPTSHGPVPMSNNMPEDSPDSDEENDSEPRT
jgi:hypothetical protein